MSLELEDTIMRKVGLGNNYRWFNGSGSCGYIRRDAISNIRSVMVEYGLVLSPKWEAHLGRASDADQLDGSNYSLTNVWIACSNAIRDAISRESGGSGFSPEEDFHFFDSEKKRQWENRKYYYEDGFLKDVSISDITQGLFKRSK